MHRRSAERQFTRLEDFTLMVPFGENKQVTLLRSLITGGLIFLRCSGPARREERSGGTRRQKKRASRLLQTPHLSSQVPPRTGFSFSFARHLSRLSQNQRRQRPCAIAP